MVRLPSGLTRRVSVADQAQRATTGHGPDFGELWERREWIRARVAQLTEGSDRAKRAVCRGGETVAPDPDSDTGTAASSNKDSAKRRPPRSDN